MSCYALLDVESILSPTPTGQWLKLPFFPGYLYAACKTQESHQVDNNYFWLKSTKFNHIILKVPSFSVYETRPESLIYHSNEFHVMDLRVINLNYRIDQNFNQFFSAPTVPVPIFGFRVS